MVNIKEALVSARKKDRAIRGKTWPAGMYMYHGRDNIMRHSDGGAVEWSVAALLATDYVMTAEAKYHGPHAEPAGIHSPKVDTDKGERKMGLINPLTQCDGCRRGLPVDDMRIHREADGHPYMVCDSSLYANAESDVSE